MSASNRTAYGQILSLTEGNLEDLSMCDEALLRQGLTDALEILEVTQAATDAMTLDFDHWRWGDIREPLVEAIDPKALLEADLSCAAAPSPDNMLLCWDGDSRARPMAEAPRSVIERNLVLAHREITGLHDKLQASLSVLQRGMKGESMSLDGFDTWREQSTPEREIDAPRARRPKM